MGTNYNPQVVTNGLQVYFDSGNTKSYPGTGTTWYDLSGNKNTATLVNSPTWVNSKGGYFSFVPNAYASTTYIQPAYDNTMSYTWCAWILINALSTACTIGNRNYTLSGTYDFTKLDQNLTFEYFHGGTNSSMAATGTTTGLWYNICIVKSLSNFYYYVNGVLVNTMTNNNTSSGNPQAFFIGGDSGAGEYGNAYISVVKTYNRNLSLSEVQQNFNALRGRYGI